MNCPRLKDWLEERYDIAGLAVTAKKQRHAGDSYGWRFERELLEARLHHREEAVRPSRRALTYPSRQGFVAVCFINIHNSVA